MTEWAWINGELTPLSEARVGIEDRGFQFADGVYEVIRLYNGRPFTLGPHLDRLRRSCAGIDLVPPAAESIRDAVGKIIARSQLTEGMVYVQITRGQSPRNHLFPRQGADFAGTLVCYARALDPLPAPGAAPGVRLLTVADERWKRCWVKSITLLPNVLAKNRAVAAGADEAVFVEHGVVSECSASNFFAVLDGRLVTHPIGPKVLPGITREVLLALAGELGIAVEERELKASEAESADELFITSTTREISWVAYWDGRPIGHPIGRPAVASGASGASAGTASECGPVSLRLHRALRLRIDRETAASSSVAVVPATATPLSAGSVDSCRAGV